MNYPKAPEHLPELPRRRGRPAGRTAADGVIADRLSVTADAAATLGAPLVLVLPDGLDLGVEAGFVWRYPSGIPEVVSPIVTAVPLELLAHSLAIHLDRHPFDYDNPTRRLVSERTIYQDGESAQTISRRHHPGNE